jgi:hypothetical protein
LICDKIEGRYCFLQNKTYEEEEMREGERGVVCQVIT